MLDGCAVAVQRHHALRHEKRTSAFRHKGRFSLARLWECVKGCNCRALEKGNKVSTHLLVLMIIVAIMFAYLITLSVWMLQNTSWNAASMPAGNAELKVVDRDAVMDVWRLYKLASATGDAHHMEAFREYLLKYKNMVEAWDKQNSTWLHGVDDKRAKRRVVMMPKSFTSEPRSLPSLLNELWATLNRIAAKEPGMWKQRAAEFLDEKLSGKSATAAAAAAAVEAEAEEPFDDILYLQLRNSFGGDATAPNSTAAQIWWRQTRATAPSVYARRYYYPVRRYHRSVHRFSPETPDVTAAWFNAMAHDYYGDEVERFVPPALSATYTNSIADLEEKHKLSPSALDSPIHTGSIFVNIASFRDVHCWSTIHDLMQRATNMFRVYIGVAQQHYDMEFPCISYDALLPQPCVVATSNTEGVNDRAAFGRGVCFPSDNVRVRHIDPSFARGPTYGRYMAMLLFRGEDYTFLLDSHIRFVYAWDSRIVTMHKEMRHPNVVLSHYPERYDDVPDFKWERDSTGYLCRANFLPEFGYVRLIGITTVSMYAKNQRHMQPYVLPELQLDPNVERPLPQPWAAAGFLFSNSTIMRDVPFDPHLSCIFNGEEVLYSMRLWTHGYDMHSPKSSICYHFYARKNEPKFWGEIPNWGSEHKRSLRRVQHFVKVRIKGVDVLLVPRGTNDSVVRMDADRYGMGWRRSVEDWYNFAGVDPVNHVVSRRWC